MSNATAPLKGLYYFVTEYGSVYRAHVFHDDGHHARNGEYATRDLADAKREADRRLRALAAPPTDSPVEP
jgi:hypothetical protein